MTTWLVFDTEADALAANDVISTNMGLAQVNNNAATGQPEPTKQQTTTWAVPRQRDTDAKWAFAKPVENMMTGVTSYTEETYNSVWFYVAEEI